MTSDQRYAMPDGFDLPDFGAAHASFTPWRDCSVAAVLEVAKCFGERTGELTLFLPDSLQDIAVKVCYEARTRLRVLPTKAFPNPLSWALSDFKTTLTVTPVA